jgi:8-oxo-dGTP diphosphatase
MNHSIDTTVCVGPRPTRYREVVLTPIPPRFCYPAVMFKDLLGAVWRGIPARLRRWGMRVIHARFTVTAGAVIFKKTGEVLLLKHRFRPGSGWGIPGGFLEAGEQPEDGLRRELREEINLEVDQVELLLVRSFRRPRQVEILFKAQAVNEAQPQSVEVEKAEWFNPAALPNELPEDQQMIVRQVVSNGAK